MSKFCSECGARLKVGAKFCSACGHKVVTELAQDSPPPKSIQEIYAEKKAANTPPAPMPYEKPKTVQEIFAERKAANTPPAPMPYEKSKTVQEIYAERKAATTPPQNYNQNYQNQTYGGWWYETFLRKDGRLNRLRFFKRTILSSCIGLVPYIIIFIVLNLNPENINHTAMLGILYTAFVAYLDYGLIVRRSHDLSRDVYWYKYIKDDEEFLAKVNTGMQALRILALFYEMATYTNLPYQIYFICDIVVYGLWFAKGEVGTNEFGTDPLERRYY